MTLTLEINKDSIVHKTQVAIEVLALIFGFLLFPSGLIAASEKPSNNISINQIGYLPHGNKIAMIHTDVSSYSIRDAYDDNIVFKADLDKSKWWKFSGQSIKIADFSEFTTPGRYYVETDGGKSFDFEISTSLYDSLCKAS